MTGTICPGTNTSTSCRYRTEACRAQSCTPGVVVVSAQTVGVVSADAGRVVPAGTLDSPILTPQSCEAWHQRGLVHRAKKKACWVGSTGPAIQLAKTRCGKLGYPRFVPSCCSRVEKAGAVCHLRMLALLRCPCGSNVHHHSSELSMEKKDKNDLPQVTAGNPPTTSQVNTSLEGNKMGTGLTGLRKP